MSSGKYAILVRHANAEWPSYVGTDFDRPLTPQGQSDAGATAAAIRDAGHRPALVLTSPARRTMQTARAIATALRLPEDAVVPVSELYNAGPEILDTELRKAFLKAGTVVLVAHNPGISELARIMTGDPHFAAFRPGHWLLVEKQQD